MRKLKLLILSVLFLLYISCNKNEEKEDPCLKCEVYSETCIDAECHCKEGFKPFIGDCISTGRGGEEWVKMMVQKGNGCYGLESTYFKTGWIDFSVMDSLKPNEVVPGVSFLLKSAEAEDFFIWDQNGLISKSQNGDYNAKFLIGVSSFDRKNYSRPSELIFNNSHFWLIFDGTFNREISEFNAWVRLYECQDGDYDVYFPKREVLVDSCFMSWEVFE